jgi:HlyD family secretion protein
MKHLAALLFICMTLEACTPGSDPELAFGTVERNSIELAFSTVEVITAIRVKEGERVSAGQVLIEQDSRSAFAQRAALQALVSQAEFKLAELQRGPRYELIDEARAMVERSRKKRHEAELELTRSSSLRQQQLLSEAELDRAKASYGVAKATLDADLARLASLEHGNTPESIEQARFALLEKKANLEKQGIAIEKLMLRAPVNGTIDQIIYEAGEQTPAGASAIVMLSEQPAYVRTYIPEPYRQQVTQGTRLIVHVDGIDKPLTGTVRTISSVAAFTPYYALSERDRSRLSYLAKIDIHDPLSASLTAGVPAQVELPAR